MIRICRILQLDRLKPWIFTRWLIKVSVYANIAIHKMSVSFLNIPDKQSGGYVVIRRREMRSRVDIPVNGCILSGKYNDFSAAGVSESFYFPRFFPLP
jgi:hypothetical protein